MEIITEIIAAIITLIIALFIGRYYKRFIKARQPEPISVDSLESSQIRHNLPSYPYYSFVGRKNELKIVMDWLTNNDKVNILSIIGIGGIGKTSLALEAAYCCKKARLFDNIIFVSVKTSILTSDGIRTHQSTRDPLKEIVESILFTIGNNDVLKLYTEERIVFIRSALAREKTLLIIDNVDAIDNQDKIITFLHNLPQEVKVIVASRQFFQLPSLIIHLYPMTKEDSLELITLEAKRKEVILNHEEKEVIFNYTYGNPLLIVFTVSRLSLGYSIQSIENQLKNTEGNLFDFILNDIISKLHNSESYELLVAFSMLAKESDKETIANLSGFKGDIAELDKEFVTLQQLNLIDKTQKNKYYIHPLIRDYIIRDVTLYPDLKDEINKRLTEMID